MKSLIVFVLVVSQMEGSFAAQKLDLTVYYESKCPDSRHFIIEQLLPAITLLGDYIDLELVPFGKGHSRKGDGYNGFHCQHGPTECRGNIVQDCALHHMRHMTDLELVSYVACEMESLAGTTGNLMCVHNYNGPVDLVNDCINSAEGVRLQMASERKTKAIAPKFIPSVTINNIFDQQFQNDSQNDLVCTLCPMINAALCDACDDRYNHQDFYTK